MPIIPALSIWKQEDQELKVSLSYMKACLKTRHGGLCDVIPPYLIRMQLYGCKVSCARVPEDQGLQSEDAGLAESLQSD